MFPVASLISTYSGRLDIKSYAHKHTYTSERISLDYTLNVKIEKNAKGQNNLDVLVE